MPSSPAGPMVVGLLLLVFLVWIWATIFKKAGYSWAMALLMLVPLVNLFVLIYFAWAEWPLEAELARCKPQDERDRPTDRIDTMLRQAAALEQRGEWRDAADLFDVLARELQGQPGSGFTAHSAKRIRQRHLS
jgi:hypothetical protein